MTEINQYTFTHQELLEMLIKHSGTHDGVWSLLVGLGVGAGNFGPTPDQNFPGVTVVFNQIGIQRVPPGTAITPGSISADAAKVNPRRKEGG
jgi:hypothetical protein